MVTLSRSLSVQVEGWRGLYPYSNRSRADYFEPTITFMKKFNIQSLSQLHRVHSSNSGIAYLINLSRDRPCCFLASFTATTMVCISRLLQELTLRLVR